MKTLQSAKKHYANYESRYSYGTDTSKLKTKRKKYSTLVNPPKKVTHVTKLDRAPARVLRVVLKIALANVEKENVF